MEKIDFERFINDKWRSKHPIPPNYPCWGSMTHLRRKVSYRLRSLYRREPASSPISILYHSGLSHQDPLPFFHSHFLQPLAEASSWNDLVVLSERFRQDNLYVLADWYPSENPQDPQHYIPTIELPVLTFQDLSVYTEKKYASFRKEYVRFMKKMFQTFPYSYQSAFRIEVFFAKLALNAQSARSNTERYKEFTRRQLEDQAFPWKLYWQDHPEQKHFLVESPWFFQQLQKEHSRFSLEAWKSYFLWRILARYGLTLSQKHYYIHERFFRTYLYGQPQPTPFWKTIVHTLSNVLPQETSELYHRAYGSPQAVKDIRHIAEKIRASLHRHIENIPWLSAKTKKKAQTKLSNILFLIGGHHASSRPRKIPLSPQASFLENLCCVASAHYQTDLTKKKVDRYQCSSSHQVNAFYDPHQNRMIIPDGILQPPFYTPQQSPACRYGSIGKIIGHEIVHAFDNYGRMFDEHGYLRPWWKKKEIAYYKKETNKIKQIYNTTRYKGVKIDGDLTQGENIADWGALTITLDAYLHDHPSSLKEFFVCYAKSRRNHYRMRFLSYLLQEDPHPPHAIRVNLVLATLPQFHKLFSIPKTSPMYLPPQKLPQIW